MMNDEIERLNTEETQKGLKDKEIDDISRQYDEN